MDLKSISLEYYFRSNGASAHLTMMPVLGIGAAGDDKNRLKIGFGACAEPEQGKLTVSGPAAVIQIERHLLPPKPTGGALIGAFAGVTAHAGRSPESGATTAGVVGQAGLDVAYVANTHTVGVKLDVGMPFVSGGTRPPALLSTGITAYLGFGF